MRYDEVFEYRRARYDVSAALAQLRRQPGVPVAHWGIEARARQLLREDGLPRARYWHWVDLDYALSLSPARLRVPGILLGRYERGPLLIDGHHRLVARWLKGYTFMRVYLVDEQRVPRA